MIWRTSKSNKPDNLLYSADEIIELIIITRLNRYNRSIPCGSKTIRQELDNLCVRPLPSLSFICKILREEHLTYRRTGSY